jgi:hypothetical protein
MIRKTRWRSKRRHVGPYLAWAVDIPTLALAAVPTPIDKIRPGLPDAPPNGQRGRFNE